MGWTCLACYFVLLTDHTVVRTVPGLFWLNRVCRICLSSNPLYRIVSYRCPDGSQAVISFTFACRVCLAHRITLSNVARFAAGVLDGGWSSENSRSSSCARDAASSCLARRRLLPRASSRSRTLRSPRIGRRTLVLVLTSDAFLCGEYALSSGPPVDLLSCSIIRIT